MNVKATILLIVFLVLFPVLWTYWIGFDDLVETVREYNYKNTLVTTAEDE